MNVLPFVNLIWQSSARTNLFSVSVSVPTNVVAFAKAFVTSRGSVLNFDARAIDTVVRMLYEGILCESAMLPGSRLETKDTQRLAPEPVYKLPYNTTYGDMELQFLCLGKDSEHVTALLLLFQQWHNFIHQSDPVDTSTDGLSRQWGFEYYDNYTTLVTVNLLDRKVPLSVPFFPRHHDPLMTYTLQRAWPIQVHDVDVKWSNESQVMRLPVTFTYHHFVTFNPSGADPNL